MLDAMPDELLLKLVETQKVYFDRKSIEKLTNVQKPKYKLAGNSFGPINVYTFFVLTTNKDGCCSYSTVCARQEHWESKDPSHLNSPESYIDIRKIEPLTGEEILIKIRDQNNRFKGIARLCDKKYEELRGLKCDLWKGGHISEERKRLAEEALSDIINIDEVNDDLLKKLGLD